MQNDSLQSNLLTESSPLKKKQATFLCGKCPASGDFLLLEDLDSRPIRLMDSAGEGWQSINFFNKPRTRPKSKAERGQTFSVLAAPALKVAFFEVKRYIEFAILFAISDAILKGGKELTGYLWSSRLQRWVGVFSPHSQSLDLFTFF